MRARDNAWSCVAVAVVLVCASCGDGGTPRGDAMAALRLHSSPPGARVWIDGRQLGVTPFAAPVIAGQYRDVRLELAGFEPWTSSIAIAPGQRVELPSVTLARRGGPPLPVPGWPSQAGLPEDFMVMVKEYGHGLQVDTTIRGLSADSAEVTFRSGRRQLACTYRLGPREIARFDWNGFVETIGAGRQRQGERWCDDEQVCHSLEVWIRAAGRALDADAVKAHRLGAEIKARVDAVTRGLEPWPRVRDDIASPIQDAVRRFDDRLGLCLREAAQGELELAVASGSGALRVITMDESAHTADELACLHEAIASSTLPSSSTCELHVVLRGYGLNPVMHRREGP